MPELFASARRPTSRRLIALCAVMFTAACGGGGGDSTDTAPASQAPSSTPTPTPAPNPDPDPDPDPDPVPDPDPDPDPVPDPDPDPVPDPDPDPVPDPDEPPQFTVADKRVGATDACYINPEFSSDGRYMVWLDQRDTLLPGGAVGGTMWHCAVDPATGELDPPDCRGFRAFDATILARANMGSDAQGPYYVGQNTVGEMLVVRPTGATTGTITSLPTPPDSERRGIFPSDLPDSDAQYVFWLKSSGSLLPSEADWVELRYIDLADPLTEIVIERQDGPAAPMDVAFPRWFTGLPVIAYGNLDADRFLQVFEVDVSTTPPTIVQVTTDPADKINPFPLVFNGRRYLVSGLDRTSTSIVHEQDAGTSNYSVVQTVAIDAANTDLTEACFAQSHEPYVVGGALNTVFQLTECIESRNFTQNTGEIWFARLLNGDAMPTRISRQSADVKNEPESLNDGSSVSVFYSSYPPGPSPFTEVCQQLRQAEVPGAQ